MMMMLGNKVGVVVGATVGVLDETVGGLGCSNNLALRGLRSSLGEHGVLKSGPWRRWIMKHSVSRGRLWAWLRKVHMCIRAAVDDRGWKSSWTLFTKKHAFLVSGAGSAEKRDDSGIET